MEKNICIQFEMPLYNLDLEYTIGNTLIESFYDRELLKFKPKIITARFEMNEENPENPQNTVTVQIDELSKFLKLSETLNNAKMMGRIVNGETLKEALNTKIIVTFRMEASNCE
jgi:hypothetical protein